MLDKLTDTAQRVRSNAVDNHADAVLNRAISAVSQVGLAGSLAAVVTYYLQPPEQLHAHVVALVIFGWNTAIFLTAYLWRRYGAMP